MPRETQMNDRDILTECFQQCLHAIEQIQQPQRQTQNKLVTTDDYPTASLNPLDASIYKFSIDGMTYHRFSQLKESLRTIIDRCKPHLSKQGQSYLLQFLSRCGYSSKTSAFDDSLNQGSLDAAIRTFEIAIASLQAFQSAWDGNTDEVLQYVIKYPSEKDRCGVYGTTLLFSAARNGHFDLVKSLVEECQCSVNAPNQQNILHALKYKDGVEDQGYQAIPSAGSTPLHAACFYGHLVIVKYLIEHGADYFLFNQAFETPLENAFGHPEIMNYFQGIMVPSYTHKNTKLRSVTPIDDEGNGPCIADCIWEYKTLEEDHWLQFSEEESKTLHKSLLVDDENQEFQRSIQLKVQRGVCDIDLLQLLCSGRGGSFNENVAWVRCRGSPLVNFRCFCFWQVMFNEYAGPHDTEYSLDTLKFPSLCDKDFRIRKRTWYSCDPHLVDELTKAMGNRRRYLNTTITIPCADRNTATTQLRFDLKEFSFNNEQNTITGFIRWIPQMIVADGNRRDRVVTMDDLRSITGARLLLLTTQRARRHVNKAKAIEDESMGSNESDDEVSHRKPTSHRKTSHLSLCLSFRVIRSLSIDLRTMHSAIDGVRSMNQKINLIFSHCQRHRLRCRLIRTSKKQRKTTSSSKSCKTNCKH
jgi:hypothetical protein